MMKYNCIRLWAAEVVRKGRMGKPKVKSVLDSCDV